MHLVLKAVSKNPSDFVLFWSTHYDFNNNELYKATVNKKIFKSKDIYTLYKWKNGRELSEKKRQFPQRIITKLKSVNELKKTWDQSKFDSLFGQERTIWKIFLMHIIQRNKFPIFDMHVYRAYKYIKKIEGKELNKYSEKEKYLIYTKEYIPFYGNLKKQSKQRHKNVDQAMWTFGKFLSIYPMIIN